MTSPLIAPGPAAPPHCSTESLHILDRYGRPIWLYDLAAQEIVWANRAGLAFWRATDMNALRTRDVRPQSCGTRQRLKNLQHSLQIRDVHEDRWTFYPCGVPVTMTVRLSLARWDTDRLCMMVEGCTRDEERGDQTRLSNGELRTAEAVRQTSLMISMLSDNGFWLVHNPAGEALMRRARLYNMPHMDNFLTMFADPEEAAALRERAREHGEARERLRIASRVPHIHDVTVRRSIDPATGLPAFIISQQDVTRLFKLERHLQRKLDKEKETSAMQRLFLSFTSHEFRTSLSIIAGSARRIRRLAEDDPTVRDRADIIGQAVDRMNKVIDRTLSDARIAEGRMDCTLELMALTPIVTRSVAIQQQLHRNRLFRLDLGDLPDVPADSSAVELMLDNILSNAVKYSLPSQPIEVSAHVVGNRIEISVKDFGIGIPADDQKRIFDRFYRASNTGQIKGSGVGLYAAHHFMKLHHGSVRIESREGQGCCVTLSFPLASQSAMSVSADFSPTCS